MRDRYVVDTNVLIAASACDPHHPADIEATPADLTLRLTIWEWLVAFQQSDSRLILDTELKIYDEYRNKLDYNDYGIQVVMDKWSTSAVDNVVVEYDSDGHGILPDTLIPIIHDLADRKMVAATLASHIEFGEGCIAFAGDTDWHDWEVGLVAHSILLEPIIESWSRAKHAEKQEKNKHSK
ncbi:hypothetical protein GBZ48_35630 [Azospirillum melinis]|uniref:PIN domain-containing protein n=1 Tax=Azospirillum melinis TaxID=328839 RepID=A0ABX2KUP5_9PROT|nr:hypothetical protein [Azospirillum melinis]MBP2309812.1 hypothetical protein [Azospirillum melinis]NUB04525.1 hypothetical protein [Azospirillum melinis]